MVPATLLAGLLCVLAGFAPAVIGGDDSISGFDQITLAPGDTGRCNSSPCTVYLKMPPGSGTYEVTCNESRVGEYPAGETVNLGSFWSDQAFAIKGMDVPKAYAYIPQIP
jgi:hypothetical protein